MLIKYILSRLKQFVIWSWQYLRLFAKWVLLPKVRNIVSSILGILASLYFSCYLFFRPKVDIDFTDPLFDGDITTSLFSIKNEGECNIYKVSPAYYIDHLKTDRTNMESNFIGSSTQFRRVKLNSEQSITFSLVKNDMIYLGGWDNQKTINAELHIYLTYKYWYETQTKQDTFKFKSSEIINNKIVWTKIQ
jgi:hypothetical protein